MLHDFSIPTSTAYTINLVFFSYFCLFYHLFCRLAQIYSAVEL